jgi:branched-chain amino acid transport system permease protein
MDFGSIFNLAIGELIGVYAAAYILAALGLGIHFGFTGLLNFGQAAFAALGAYGYAIATLTFGWGLWGSVAFGLVCSAAFAVVLGIPTLRLRADYLAIVTIAAAQALVYAFKTSQYGEVTGGANGLSQFGEDFYALNPIGPNPATEDGRYDFGIITMAPDELFIRIVAWVLVILMAVLLIVLTRSPWGRVLKGIREDEDAVRSLGKNVFAYKLQALVIGGTIASFGGMIFVLSSQTNQPSTWGTNFTFMLWTILLLGGAATILGPVVGGMVFFALLSLTEGVLSGLVNIGWLPFLDLAQVGQIRYLMVGLILMLLVIFRPQGLFGNKKEMQFNG